MNTRSWLRNLFSHSATRPIRKAPRRTLLSLEALEDRTVPSTFTVTNLLDNGSAGSLRWAVGQANSHAGSDTINFGALFNTPQTITLSGGQLELTDATGTEAITGPAAGVTVSGNNASRVFQVDANVAATISGLTITGGVGGQELYGNRGGGVFNAGQLTLSDCTVSGNSANLGGGGSGGGVYNNGTMAMTNCTISGNSADGDGGGVVNRVNAIDPRGHTAGALAMTNCTVTGNSAGYFGGGVDSDNASILSVRNTIIAGNGSGDVLGAFASQGNNLVGRQDAATSSGWVSTDILNTSAQLEPLGNYGGPTQTVALLPNSPAINAGASGTGVPTTDQRGLGRVGATDIGAVESQGYTLTPVAGSTPQSADADFAFANPLGVTLTENVTHAPISGVTISFAVPASGAGLTATTTQTATTDATGAASLAVTANDLVGDYTVTASTPGAGQTSFRLHNNAVTSIAVTPGNASVFDGLTQQFTATAVYADGSTHDITSDSFVTWASATPAVATISGTGLASTLVGSEQLTARTSVITASLGGITSPGVTLTVVPLLHNTFMVTNTNDSGAGSLRDAISTYGHDAVTFDPSVFGKTPQTITLTSGALNLTVAFGDVSVQGFGADELTIDGGRTDLIFNVSPRGSASLSGLTITGGEGDGVDNHGTLTMTGVTVRDMVSTRPNSAAAGVNNTGTLTMTDCTVSGDTALFLLVGVFGVLNSGTLAMSGCTVSGNGGGENDGSGVANSGTLAMTNCTVSGNACQGVGNSGALTMTNCTVSGNSGIGHVGGVANAAGTLTLTGCTVSGNSNNANVGGGGAGIYNYGGTLTLNNSIVAINGYRSQSLIGLVPDIRGAVAGISGYNIIGNDDGLSGILNGINGNQIGTNASLINPLLGPLARRWPSCPAAPPSTSAATP
jgi:Bacterial Ig-like domain (group 2)